MSLLAVAARADRNFRVHATWAPRRSPGMRVQDDETLMLVDSGLACDTFNLIGCARWPDEAAARTGIAEAIAHFAVVDRPFSWWCGPDDLPHTMGHLLEEAGLEAAEGELAMAMSLDDLPDLGPRVAGLAVHRVETEQELQTFARILAANWSPPDLLVPTFFSRVAPVALEEDAPVRYYLGWLNGEPVATAECTVAEGTAGLYNICTLEAYRGRGIGSVMTYLPLADAQADGCDLAVLQASAQGVGVYARLGFTTFGTVTEYKLPA